MSKPIEFAITQRRSLSREVENFFALEPGKTLKNWRRLFQLVPQRNLASLNKRFAMVKNLARVYWQSHPGARSAIAGRPTHKKILRVVEFSFLSVSLR